MRDWRNGDLLVLILAAAAGAFVFMALSDYMLLRGPCPAGDLSCWRDWTTAWKEWGALTGSIAGVAVLVLTLRETTLSNQRQLRAYIDIREVSAKGLRTNAPIFMLSFKNHGSTPARDVRVFASVEIAATDAPMPDVLQTKPLLFNDMPPKEEFSARYPFRSISRPEMVVLRARSSWILVFGVIMYVDAFGQSRQTWFKKYVACQNGVLADGDLYSSSLPNNTT